VTYHPDGHPNSPTYDHLRIPVNVTADSGERDRGSVLRVLILCRLVFPAVFLSLSWIVFQFMAPARPPEAPLIF
jgi:hypothetical protein